MTRGTKGVEKVKSVVRSLMDSLLDSLVFNLSEIDVIALAAAKLELASGKFLREWNTIP